MRSANQDRHRRRRRVARIALASAAAAVVAPLTRAEVSANSSGSAQQNGVGNPAVTISMSGSTAMRNFTTSPFITLLTPGSSITLNNGAGGAPVLYNAPNIANASFQLASPNFTNPDVPVGGPFPSTNTAQIHSAIRFEWHEQGAIEGILDLTNDQIGYFGGATGTAIVDLGGRNPNGGNPIWVNQKSYTAPTAGTNGLSLQTSNYNTYLNYDASGRNLQGGQNRVQMAISDCNAQQGFAVGGTSAAGAFGSTAGNLGYGKGNNTHGLALSTLPTNGAAVAGGFYQLKDQTILNMETTKLDPATGANYSAGAWNSGGINNLDNHAVAVTATLFVANPGTGLDKLNRADGQSLLTTGHLTNGAAFNMTTRDIGSGTHNVMANNVGVDPSWTVGVNDDGNGNNLTAGHTAADQANIGPAQRFSNKTAGGGQVRPTVQNNRMAIGELGMSDAIGSVKDNSSGTPLRALSYSDSADGSSGYVRASASTITDGSYVIWQNETYVTVKAPNGAFAGDTANQWAARTDAETGIKGDNAGSNVAQFRANILSSVTNFPNTNSLSNPADGLLNKSFILPQMMQKAKNLDGVGTTFANPGYNDTLRSQFLASGYAANFNPADPNSVTTGSGSAYGKGGNNTASFNGQIPITAKNYLFGNFNQLGTRDYAALQTAQAAQAALATSGAGVSMFTADGGSANSTAVPTGVPALDTMNSGGNATKGDLVVLGDLNGDGRFDGKDLYLFASGAALADSTNVASLTPTGGETLGDALRRGVLRKNDALDWLQSHATAQQKLDASPNLVADPTGANAFNKFDINRDGRVSRNDAAIVDKFFGWDKTNINHQLSATINTDGSINPAGTQRLINLYQVGLVDGQNTIGRPDFSQIRAALGSHLAAGDVNFDGQIDKNDIRPLATSGFFNDGLTTHKWSEGDFNGDGAFDKNDIRLVATSGLYNTGNYDGGNPPIPTPTLTGRTATPATASAPTFVYNPSTGDVTVSTNGNPGVVELDLISAGNKFITANSKLAAGGLQFITNTTHEQDGFTQFGSFIADGFDLGNILPAGLTDQQIAQDLTAFYSATGNVNGAPANVITPEPATFSLLGLGAAGLLARRRRRK